MACVSCVGCDSKGKKTSTGVSGCKSNGGCESGGCNKMNVFDWLGNMEISPLEQFSIIEVRFKNGGKAFFRNTDSLELYKGDPIIVEMSSGYHLGFVSLQGELVRLQMLKKHVKDNDKICRILRKASQRDIEKFEETQKRNYPTLYRTRQIIKDLKLKMKLSDVEFQADNTKAIFFYSADERVDFRELIRVLATEFKVRVEMKQISLRQEASRVGGIGVCGRELCCSTWLSNFRSVTTAAARYQNLSLNPSKLSGQCGRLKCCLNYELETYMEALKDIPKVEKPLLTKKGRAFLQKTDIFRKKMWFGYEEETTWHVLSTERVAEIIALNKQGKIPETLESNKAEVTRPKQNIPLIKDLDKPKNKRRRRKNNYKTRDKQQTNTVKNQQQQQNNSPNKKNNRNKNRSRKRK